MMGIIGVILLQSLGSATILYAAYYNQYRKLAYYAVLGFIAFNIAATAIFHFPPVGSEYNNFFKNLSITGGFILLLDRFA